MFVADGFEMASLQPSQHTVYDHCIRSQNLSGNYIINKIMLNLVFCYILLSKYVKSVYNTAEETQQKPALIT